MKQRKLFAILTLVAFMMTLLPMAAFADTTPPKDTNISAGASYIDADRTNVRISTATTDREIKFTLVLRNSAGEILDLRELNENEVYVKTARDTEKVVVAGTTLSTTALGGELGAPLPKYVAAAGETPASGTKTDVDGAIEVLVSSRIAGESTVSFYLGNADAGILIGQQKVNFTSVSTDINKTNSTLTSNKGSKVTVGEETELRARIADDNSNGISGKDVVFQYRKANGTWFTIDTVRTNAVGVATLKVTETVAGSDYDYRVRVDGETIKELKGFEWEAADAVKVEAVAVNRSVEAKTATQTVKFIVKDYFGNKINDAGILEAEYRAVPEDAAVSKDDPLAVHTTEVNSDKEYQFLGEFDEPGTYVVRAYLADSKGLWAETTVTASKLAELKSVSVNFKKDSQTSLRAVDSEDAKDELKLEVKVTDVNGVTVDADQDDFFKASSDVSLVTVVSNDFIVKGPNNKDKRGVATITYTHKTNGLSASIDVPVVGGPAQIDAAVSVSGKDAAVTLRLLDSNGRPTYVGTPDDVEDLVYNINAPGLTTANVKKFDKSKDPSKATFDLRAAEYGVYNVTVFADNGIAKTFAVEFKAPAAEKPAFGAKNVTLFIGSTGAVVDGAAKILDVAPFIKDNRTFVPVRFVAEALGAEVKFDAATQVVTATRGDDVIVLTIGSNVFTVNGEAQVTDVAPFIAEGNRTVLPFRAIAEAFGAEVEAGFAADGTTSHVVFRQ